MADSFEITTESAEQTQAFGEQCGHTLLKGSGVPILCCYGELGSGKTTFVQGLARGLGIPDRLISPTFVIVRRYKIPSVLGYLYHIDAYRLTGEEKDDSFGFQDILREPNSVVVVEWPERLREGLPQKRQDLYFTTLADGRHMIHIKEGASV